MDDAAHTHSRRMRMFVMAVAVGLASGSNYVYSGYAPQLAASLGISSTDVNLIGLAGNLGMYLTGPIWGRIVDARGQRIPLLLGCSFNFVGYSLVRLYYLGIIPIRTEPDLPAARPLLALLGLAMFCTGVGGSAGLSSAVNAAAKSFPDRTRASATGTVLAGFGLSAFAFSMLGQLLYHGEAGGLLLLLSLGTSLPMLAGSFIVRAIPPDYNLVQDKLIEGDDNDNEELSLARQISLGTSPEGRVSFSGMADRVSRANEVELERSRSPVRGRPRIRGDTEEPASPTDPLLSSSVRPKRPRADSLSSIPPTAIHYTPLDLIRLPDFYILFVVLALLCGVGLEWINNVGAVTLAIARDGWTYDSLAVSAYQAKQVATISVLNCAGRILGGVFSDFFKIRYGMKRIWFLPVVAMMFLASEIAVLNTVHVSHLWLVSASLGLAYGSLFNVVPMLVLEWFGMSHFSQNYGWTCVAPIIGGNAFNLLFGRVYDSNTVGRIGGPPPPAGETPGDESLSGLLGHFGRSIVSRGGGMPLPSDGKHECLIGAACYRTAFRVSALGCVVAFCLSIVAGIRRERMSAERKRSM